MNIKRYFAPDLRRAINLVRTEHGPDAVILSSDTVDGGVEVIAALDYDQSLVKRMLEETGSRSEPAEAEVRTAPAEVREVEPETEKAPAVAATAPAKTESAVAEQKSVEVLADDAEAAETSPADNTAGADTAEEPVPAAAVNEQQPALALTAAPALATRSGAVEFSDLDTTRELRAIQKDLFALKGLMRERFAWSDMRSMSPQRKWLMRRAEAFGLTAELADTICLEIERPENEDSAWREVIFNLARRLSVLREDPIDRGGVFAFVGPTGVGKTTTIAKLAAQHCLKHGRESLALITTDSLRIGAHRQLDAFAAILGVPVRTAANPEALAKLLDELKSKRLILIDTAGTAPRDRAIRSSLVHLNVESDIRSFLVLAANMQPGVMQGAVDAFGGKELAGIVLTKLDETDVLGAAISVLASSGLPAAWLSDGQRVPEDLKFARVAHLLKRATVMPEAAEPSKVPAFITEAAANAGGGIHAGV